MRKWLFSKKGQSTIEYILLLAIVVLVISQLRNEMKSNFEEIIRQVFSFSGDLLKDLRQ